ncbi:DJ-1 family protein [Spirochaetia bacterium]|nr:DJ-1 family protein [Spirochaetia bacterium]
MSKKIAVFLAEGFEEVEAVTPIDYLRRAGIEVTTVSVGGSLMVKGSHGIPIAADTSLEALQREGRLSAASWDGAVVPGGMPGAAHAAASAPVGALLTELAAAGKLTAAICAAPAVVFAPLGLLRGRRFTCYPGLEAQVTGAAWLEEKVVIDGGVITSRGAGTAAAFAIALIGYLVSGAEAERIARSVLLQD